MNYVGSKNRLSKELAPIIQSYVDKGCLGYLEPFVGGAGMIDKINCKVKVGCDIHRYLIALLKQAQMDCNSIDIVIPKEDYTKIRDNKDSYDDWYVGLCGFCFLYNSKWFGGYNNNIQTKQGIRNYGEESVRGLIKQAPKLKDIIFKCCDFRQIQNVKGFVIYCDPPYKNTIKYSTNEFPYDEFYEWCRNMSKDNIVLISEYSMPNDFKCIWSKETTTTLNNNRSNKDNNRIEKLFIYNN